MDETSIEQLDIIDKLNRSQIFSELFLLDE